MSNTIIVNHEKVNRFQKEDSQFSYVTIFNTRIHNISMNQLIDYIDDSLHQNKKRIIGYANIYALNIAYENEWFQEFMNNCDLVYCDGFGVLVGSKILGFSLNHRITPPDWIYSLLDKIDDYDTFRLFILGAKPDVVEKTANLIKAYKPDIQIRYHHGYFEKEPKSKENQTIINIINDFQPQLLLVGLGMPLQEKWIFENYENIQANVILSVGALFDYMSGNVKRAPSWMTNHGMEWLGRLYFEPKRLWRRYIIGIPVFVFRIIRELIFNSTGG